MMKKALCIGLVIALGALSAQAATFSTWEQGALRMKLKINNVTGEAWLVSLNSSTATGPGSSGNWALADTMIDIDGITISSPGAHLVPALTWNNTTKTVTNGWFSIGDAFSKKNQLTSEALGDYVSGFGRLNPTATSISEANVGGYAEFIAGNVNIDPVTYPMNYEWYIGKPIVPGTASLADLKFVYHTTTASSNQMLGVIEIVPEPATMALLVTGGIGMLLRKRRRS